MDMLGHVNNVTYVDYLQEARIDLLSLLVPEGGRPSEGVVVVRHKVQFASPLTYRDSPVTVEIWVTEVRAATFTMAYEIVDEHDGERVVHVRATTKLVNFDFESERPRRLSAEERALLERFRDEPTMPGSDPVPALTPGRGHPFPLSVRWSDVDAYGHVNNVTYVEYFQEARIGYLANLMKGTEGVWARWVVAQTDIDFLRPVLYRREPYTMLTTVGRVGERSTALVAELRDGDTLLARSRSVLVTFDLATQASTVMPEDQRATLLAELE